MNELNHSDEIHKLINEITELLAQMPKEKRLAWFGKTLCTEPMDFVNEIGDTVYVVRTYFKHDASESIFEKVERITQSGLDKI